MMIPGIKKILFLFVAVLFIFLLVFSGCTEEKNGTGDDFSFTTLNGEMKRLSDFSGKIVVLDCMAVNCQPCMYQMFELQKISENYSSNDVAILSIDVWVSNGETASMLQEMINEFKNQANMTLNWTFGLDDPEGTIENTYAKEGVPSLYIYDKKGNIYYSHVGYESYTDLVTKIDEALIKN
ncbi:MAG: TlpA disulfide reductase family protein [Euryarchaeota archaeon]|jgi:thiol-disulfide isomerase/thioredoxin|nr:TlpA disulfide reductase family protein [Euryarchaeota archaeon]